MNIEFTGKYDAVATKRFAGKIFDRFVRRILIFCYVFLAACVALEALTFVRSGRFDFHFLFLVIPIILIQKFQRSRFQKAMDGISRRFMGDSEEVTLVMTDDSYECRCGANLMRVAWRNLGSHYLFVGDGVAMMEGKMPTLLIPCLEEKGVQADELKDALARAGLNDYRSLRSHGWCVLFLVFVVGGVVVFSNLARSRPQFPQGASCIDEEDANDDEDEDEWGDDFGSSGQKSFSLGDIDFDSRRIDVDYSLADVRSQTNKHQISYQDFANIVAVLREQKSRKTVSMLLSIDDVASPARPLDTLATLTNSYLSIDLVLNGCTNLMDVASCMCCGHPGVDWWKGDVLVARTAVQHLQGLRRKGLYGDACLVPESRKLLGEWFAARNIKVCK